MNKIYSDLCSISNSNETINIDYIPYTGLGISKTYYKKGRFSCSNSACNFENCPLYNKAPLSF